MTRPMPTTRRIVAVAALAALTALPLAGCTKTSQVQTDFAYTPADGVNASTGDVLLRNVFVVSGEKGGAGTLSGLAVNQSDSAQDLTVQGAGSAAPVKISVPARGTAQLAGTGTTASSLSSIDAVPGSTVPLTFTTASGGTTQIAVPVLYPQSYLSTLAPSGFTAPPSPTATASESGEGDGH